MAMPPASCSCAPLDTTTPPAPCTPVLPRIDPDPAVMAPVIWGWLNPARLPPKMIEKMPMLT